MFVLLRSVSKNDFSSVQLPSDYNMHEVPWDIDGLPLTVNFSINLKSILDVDEPQQVSSILQWKIHF